jgi:arylsulfatase
MSPGDSVAVVVLDTLRKDAFDRHFDWLPGRRFDRAFSTSNWTVPAHASLFTGRYASEVGVHGRSNRFDCPETALAERLRAAGYTTRAFSANTNVTGHFGFDRGFDRFEVPGAVSHLADDDLFDWRAFNKRTDSTGIRKYLRGVAECVRGDCATLPSLRAGLRVKRSDGTGVAYGGAEEALATVEGWSFGEREFLYLNLMETHEPYRVPASYATVPEPAKTDAVGDLVSGEFDPERVRTAYDDCARYLSDVYRVLFDRLRSSFDYVITCSDHGELLGEGGAWGHEFGLDPALTRVPLAVSGPDTAGREAVADPVSLLDVHATVLEAAGVDPDSGGSRGRSLLSTTERPDRLTEFLGLTPWSRDRLRERDGPVDRYDAEYRGLVAGGYYGYETPDGFVEAGADPPDDPRSRLASLAGDLDDPGVESEAEVPAAVRDRLRDLGYA